MVHGFSPNTPQIRASERYCNKYDTMATPHIGQTPQLDTSNISVISQSNCIRFSIDTLVNTVNIIMSFFCMKISTMDPTSDE